MSIEASISSKPSTWMVKLLVIIYTFSTPIKSQNNTNSVSSDYFQRCSPFNCGNLTFSFPFSLLNYGSGPTNCGLPTYQIACDNNDHSSGIILSGRLFQVKDIYLSDHLITVVDTKLINDLTDGSCTSLPNLTISSGVAYSAPLSLPPGTINLTLFVCPSDLTLPQEFLGKQFSNYICDDNKTLIWQNMNPLNPPNFSPLSTPNGCHLVKRPVSVESYRFLNISNSSSDRRTQLVDILGGGFPLTWPSLKDCDSCNSSGGRCGFDANLQTIVCFHRLGSSSRKWKKRKLIGVIIGSCSPVLIIVLVLAFRKRISPIFKTKNQSTEDKINVEQFVKNYQSSLLSNYSYSDIKKMTNGFREKLGEGGYGNVYKGKLSDGRLVAVKLLENVNNNGRDFVNEVSTIGRIHHVNVIRLLGFSWNGSKQALIYEYMPNGSLADLLSSNEFGKLSLGPTRMLEVAIGIAHGLEYLHNGCESRILHLDIKPQNVLLDQNLEPKISDFGLAKIYSRSRTAVTITDARGTIGYVAPEIFMRNLGNPSHKSDVYSYGMLLLEMVGAHAEPNVTSSSSEAYFPGWIHDKLVEQINEEPERADSVVEEDGFIWRKMVTVGLWCIQINPKERPSMTRVVEMLSGEVDVIKIPPKPVFISPPHVQHDFDMASSKSDTSDLPLNIEIIE